MMARKIICFFGKILFYFKKKEYDLNKIKKILVFKSGAIGDVLMSTPFLRALRRRFPNARIDYWVGKWSKEVLIGNPNIDNIFEFDETILFKKNIFKIIELIKKIRKEKYDAAFTLDKHWLSNIFIYFCRIPIRIGFDRFGEGFANTINVKYGPLKHEVDYYLELAYKVGAEKTKERQMELFLSEKDLRFADDFIKQNNLENKEIIGIAPGGAINPGQRMPSRRWPKERFLELCKRLVEKGYKIILFGGPGDEDVGNYLIHNVYVYSVIGKTTIKETAALMKKCRLIICNDSGPMHIAASVNVPIISIFGPTDPRRKAPLGKKHKYLWNKMNLGLSDVYGRYTKKQNENIKRIKVEDVLKILK